MVFKDFTKISAGAAAGVYAEKQGYVDTGVAHYSSFAAQNGLPTPEIVLSAVPDTKEVSVAAGSLPTMEEFQDRVAQGLEYARKLFQDFIPSGLPSVPSVPGGDVEAPAPSPPAAKSGSASSSSALPYLAFLAGAGTGAAVYYYGPDKCKAYVEKCVERVRERVRESLAAAKAWATRLDPATRLNEFVANVSPTVDTAKATVKEFCTKTFVPAVRTAAERCAGEVKAVTDKVGPTVTLVVDRCTGHVVAITETVKPRFGQLQEAVKPHLIAVQVAVKDLIGALLALAPKPPAGDEAK
mmetsp:Transcript_8525/g.37591  ORF Transcript_8525/g.37591 Transcript_8525/m.37591 type:complete len:297 (-) Transcript_8525:281-1171(-)